MLLFNGTTITVKKATLHTGLKIRRMLLPLPTSTFYIYPVTAQCGTAKQAGLDLTAPVKLMAHGNGGGQDWIKDLLLAYIKAGLRFNTIRVVWDKMWAGPPDAVSLSQSVNQ